MKAMQCGESKCFAFDRNKKQCRILIGDPYKRDCPFYKTSAEYKYGLAKWAEYYGKEMMR